MFKNDIQEILDRFGFSKTIDQKIEHLNLSHVMHMCQAMKRLVEYYVDDVLNTIKAIWVFDLDNVRMIENKEDFEKWLHEK